MRILWVSDWSKSFAVLRTVCLSLCNIRPVVVMKKQEQGQVYSESMITNKDISKKCHNFTGIP